jgi:hypothetical protein
MKFNPNKDASKPKVMIWGTFIQNRRPKWKTYSQLSHAIASLKDKEDYPEDTDPRLPEGASIYSYRILSEQCTLWQLVDNTWVEVAIKRFYKKGDKLL